MVLVCWRKAGFNEFIYERESKRPDDPTVKLFDEVILAKKNRGKSSFFNKTKADFLTDTTDHLWRTASANPPSSRFPGDYRSVISRIPSKLDPTLMKEPRVIQGVPRIPVAKARRKPIPSMLGPGGANTQLHTSWSPLYPHAFFTTIRHQLYNACSSFPYSHSLSLSLSLSLSPWFVSAL
jgi:hypothetical protein